MSEENFSEIVLYINVIKTIPRILCVCTHSAFYHFCDSRKYLNTINICVEIQFQCILESFVCVCAAALDRNVDMSYPYETVLYRNEENYQKPLCSGILQMLESSTC